LHIWDLFTVFVAIQRSNILMKRKKNKKRVAIIITIAAEALLVKLALL
jgi:hypothetical protein